MPKEFSRGQRVAEQVRRELAELIPGARMHLIRGAGHLTPVEQPQAFADVLAAFLRTIAET